ncbi:P-loop containing nucleoside triphosphate hydrolase protein [Lentinus tigrinus ALCF2SS1-7]|uniref:P-loop containing nucleoside triphosphate hydrolase protein n=1 Tax=Lentinus tigrinus ALCF2SS1-7 TaxID=1328758 RepID=UPI0011660E37|nr:P-loop containing nucleoside triphosphate hydrolase protein [Lentinus tigrinus ALCF2SS1-7]
MAPLRENVSSVLGKRSHQTAQVDASGAASPCDFQDSLALPTPDSTPHPKRAKTTGTVLDGDHNKENIPPFLLEAINASPSTLRRTRSLRRTSTMVHNSSSRPSTPRRYASTSDLRQAASTPATSLSQLSLATPPPSPPSALLPLQVRAKALLRPTCNGGPSLAGREQEKAAIEAFILGFIFGSSPSEDASALYISGAPGTGKTAMVNAVLASLAKQLQAQSTDVLAVNCMALDGVDSVWQRLAELFGTPKKTVGRGRKTKATPQQIVEKALAASDQKCIVVLDEMDHIVSSTQALSPLFALAHTFSPSLRLVGIANTHTLTSSSSTTISVQSLAGVQTLHFAPYTSEQLLAILRARLASLSEDEDAACVERVKKFLPVPTLTLLSKKIAAQTGDVRAVFEVLRGAIDIAVNAITPSDPLNSPTPAVTPAHVLAALKAYAPAGKTTPALSATVSAGPSGPRKASDSETVMKIRELGLQQRLVLLSALLAVKSMEAGVPLSGSSPVPSPGRSPVKRTQSSSLVQPSASKATGFDIGHLHSFYTTILGRAESGVFTSVSRSEFGDLAGVLEVVGLLSLSCSGGLPSTPRKSGKKSFSRSMSFTSGASNAQEARFVDGVRLDEVVRGLGLGVDDIPADVREEELRAIYQREQARIAREVKARGQSGPADMAGFADAMED